MISNPEKCRPDEGPESALETKAVTVTPFFILKYLLRVYSVPGTVPGSEKCGEERRTTSPELATAWWGKQTRQ